MIFLSIYFAYVIKISQTTTTHNLSKRLQPYKTNFKSKIA